MGPQRWKMASLRGVLSPQGYLTVCPLILHIDFAGFLYQGLCRQTVPVLKKLTASGFEGMVPPQAPARPPTTLPLATRNLLAAPWLLSLPLLFSWLGCPFTSSTLPPGFFFLQNWVQMFPLPEAFLVFLAALPRAPSELPSDSPITARSTQLSPPSFWPSQAASTGGNTKAPQGQRP